MKFPFLNNETLPRKVKKLFSPRRTFSQNAKGRFLVTFDAAHGQAAVHDGAVRAMRPHGSRIAFVFKMIAVSAAGIAVLVGGFSAYADTTNVPIESPLYPLKRLAENVQLAVTPAAAKPELEATLATRRAGEITDLETKHPSSTLIAKLTADLTMDVAASIGGALQADQTAQGGHSAQATPQSGDNGENQNNNNGGMGSSGNNGEGHGSRRFHTLFGTSTTSTASSTASTTISAIVTSTASSSVSGENDGQGYNQGQGDGQGNGNGQNKEQPQEDKKNTLTNVCNTLRPILSASSSLSENIFGRFHDIARFEAQCSLVASSTPASSPDETPTSTPSPTSTTTPAPTSTERRFMPFRPYRDASSTMNATTSVDLDL